MRYQYYTTDNKVICVSHYAGKPVRGVAKCFPTDEFDLEVGKKLAKLRCDYKIAEKRVLRSQSKYLAACKAAREAQEYERRMHDYYMESANDLVVLDTELMELKRNI